MPKVSVLERRKNRVAKKIIKRTVVKGDFTIHNVPFVECDSELNDFRMTGKSLLKLDEIIQYMKDNGQIEFDYGDF